MRWIPLINFNYKKFAYVAGIVNDDYGLCALGKLDTGAVKTLIYLRTFEDTICNKEFIKYFKNIAARQKIEDKEFTTANNVNVTAYPCSIDYIIMGDVMIKGFRFYLVIEPEANKVLIGDDFLSCCQFKHTIGGPIIIEQFDDSRYAMNTRKIEAINFNEAVNQFLSHWQKKYTAQEVAANYMQQLKRKEQ